MRFGFGKKRRENVAPKTNALTGRSEASEKDASLKPSLTEPATKSVKEKIVDTVGGVTYSLITGTMLDYAAGLSLTGIIASRTSATVINSFASAPYGMWRNFIFRTARTTEESGWMRKRLTDFLAFNTFQVPIYATGVAIGSLVSEGSVDWEKVRSGSLYLASVSPLIAPTMGWYMDRMRMMFGIGSAAEQAGSKTATAGN